MPPTLMAILRASLLLAVPVAGLTAQCLSAGDLEAIAMRDSWRAMLVLGEAPEIWRWLGLTGAQKDSIVLVDEAALCERAATAIAEFRGVAVGEFTFALMRAGSGYLAQSSDLRVNGMQTTYEFDGDMSLRLPRITLPAATPGGPSPPLTESRCFGAGEEFTLVVRGRINRIVSRPDQAVLRERPGLELMSTDSVRHVADPDICVRAIAAIKEFRGRAGEEVEIALFRVGPLYWAESNWPRAGGWNLTFMLDSTATRVVGQY